MRDDTNRVTVALWNIIKPCMKMRVKGDLTPTYGEIVDRFRTLWGIYISVTPATDDDILISKFRYEIFRLVGNEIKDQFTGSDYAYYLAMRKAIQKAYEFVGEIEA